MVAEAYKQAGDQENFIKWLDVAKKAEKDYIDESMSELDIDY
jgi:S-adenosylmethionine synthetase